MGTTRPGRRRFTRLAAIGACTLTLPWRALGAATAPSELRWHDGARARELPLLLRVPDGDAPVPLVLHSHGLGGSRFGGDAWGRAWRDAGLMVLHLQHPGSDDAVWRAGVARLREAASAEQLVARAADVAFVLDEIARRARAGEAPWTRVRPDAIGVAGHSFGAQTVQAVAGRRYPQPGSLADARPRAFVALSPSLGRVRMTPAEQMGAVTRPFLCVSGTLDGDPFGSYDDGTARRRVYEGLPPGAKAELYLDGADHYTLAGNEAQPLDARALRRERVAVESQAAHHALVARITTWWWRAHLADDRAARDALQAPAGLGPRDIWHSA